MSEVSICNGALTHVGASLIASLDDDTDRAELCKELYPRTRDEALSRHAWGFATKRAQLAQSATGPLFDYSLGFTLPIDFLKLISTSIDGPVDSLRQPIFSIEGNELVTDEAAPIKIRYIARITSTGLFPIWFSAYLEFVLADKLAFRLKQQISSIFKAAIKDDKIDAELAAMSSDSQQFPSSQYDESNLMLARQL